MTTFTIGAVLRETFAVLRRNLVAFVILALLIEALNRILGNLFAAAWVGDVENLFDPGVTRSGALVILALDILLRSLLVAPITYITYHDLRGRPVPIGQGLGRGLGLVPRVIGLSVVYGFLLMLAFMLFVIPGLIVSVMWWVAVPVLVVEGLGPLKSLYRSADLTHGSRWKVFGVLVVLVIPFVVIGLIEGALMAASGPSGGPFFIVVDAVINALGELITAISAAVAYFHLRRAKEGIEIEDIAAVFD